MHDRVPPKARHRPAGATRDSSYKPAGVFGRVRIYWPIAVLDAEKGERATTGERVN